MVVIVYDDNWGRLAKRSNDLATQEWETRAKSLLKAELKRQGVTYRELAGLLAGIGVRETDRNLNNKISRGGFSAVFLIQCLAVIGVTDLRLSWGSGPYNGRAPKADLPQAVDLTGED